MKGIMDIGGQIVKNKAEAIREAIRLCEMNDPEHNNGFRAYVMKYDDPEIIWFSVGYGDYEARNYVKLDPKKTTEYYEKFDAYRARMEAKITV